MFEEAVQYEVSCFSFLSFPESNYNAGGRASIKSKGYEKVPVAATSPGPFYPQIKSLARFYVMLNALGLDITANTGAHGVSVFADIKGYN